LENKAGDAKVKENMKAAIYTRVSTAEQDTQNQLMVLWKWAKQRDFEVVKVYEEEESAWKANRQKALARLKDDAQQRKFNIVLVWALDRLTRQGAAEILNLINTFNLYSVKVLSYQESWTEAPGAVGEILYAIAGWVAKMESARRSERTKAGLAKALANGKKLGRPSGAKDTRKRKRTGYLLRYVRG